MFSGLKDQGTKEVLVKWTFQSYLTLLNKFLKTMVFFQKMQASHLGCYSIHIIDFYNFLNRPTVAYCIYCPFLKKSVKGKVFQQSAFYLLSFFLEDYLLLMIRVFYVKSLLMIYLLDDLLMRLCVQSKLSNLLINTVKCALLGGNQDLIL